PWHPLVRRSYADWCSVAPPGCLPGRQHIAPEEIPALWSRLWMLDVHRDPLRYRYRLCGTEMVRSLGHEVTGHWLDEAHPQLGANAQSRDRFRFIVEQAQATWRRGPPLWNRDPEHRTIETCIPRLAAVGRSRQAGARARQIDSVARLAGERRPSRGHRQDDGRRKMPHSTAPRPRSRRY